MSVALASKGQALQADSAPGLSGPLDLDTGMRERAGLGPGLMPSQVEVEQVMWRDPLADGVEVLMSEGCAFWQQPGYPEVQGAIQACQGQDADAVRPPLMRMRHGVKHDVCRRALAAAGIGAEMGKQLVQCSGHRQPQKGGANQASQGERSFG